MNTVEFFFSETCRLEAKYDDFRNMLSHDELLRADQLHFKEMKHTYVISHGFLRLLLGRKLGIKPADIAFLRDARNKPFLKDHSLHFNLSHTKNAFAVAVCSDFQIGIDIEEVNTDLNYGSVSGTVLNSRERTFVEENRTELYDRFYLLWTRKEAYMKGIGTGIISNMWKIVSFQKPEALKRGFQEDRIAYPSQKEYYVYSEKILNYFLSIASPEQVKIQTNIVDEACHEKPDPVILH